MKYLLIISIILISLFSCKKNDDFGPQTDQNNNIAIKSTNGLYVINEGNYSNNNGSLSYINLDSNQIANNLFYNKNKKYLGDVPQSMTIIDNLAYIIVNHSSKIEIINAEDFSSHKTISGLKSPRYMCRVGQEKAYISDLYSDSLVIFDLKNNSINGYINIGRSSDKILTYNNIAYILNWSNLSNPSLENNKIVKIDVINDVVMNEIEVSKEPNSIAIDKDNKIWVLCSGGYDNSNYPALIRINPESDNIELQLDFPSISASPSSLAINHTGDTLYYINNGVYKLGIYESQLPVNKIIEMNNSTFYNIAISPHDNSIIVSDAKNYNSQGQIHIYNNAGNHKLSFDAGIIPGDMVFD